MGVDIALLFVRRGDIPAARAVVRRNPESLEEAHVEMRGGLYDAARAAVAIAEGHPAEALVASERGLTSSLELSFPVVACQNLVEAVDAAFALGRDDKVAELIALARGHYRPGRQRSIDAHIHRWQAMLAARRGDDAGAVMNFELAVDEFTALTRPFWLAATRLEDAAWLTRQGRDAAAADLSIQARSAFARLGARPWIDRVDAAARAPGSTVAEAKIRQHEVSELRHGESRGGSLLRAVRCGSSARACASCGAAYNEGERFCGECGSALAAGMHRRSPQSRRPRSMSRAARNAGTSRCSSQTSWVSRRSRSSAMPRMFTS